MTFTDQQKALLSAPLSTANVKKNPRGYDYVEGWHAIAEANRIFGFDGWDRQTIDMRQLGEPELVNGNWRVAYHCRVRVTVRADGTEITRDGSGYGSGIVKDVRDAHESAIKEAETDAMKRALMTFGNPFGLALYDKQRANVTDEQPASEAKLTFIGTTKEKIREWSGTGKELGEWWNSEEQKQARRFVGLDQSEVDALKTLVQQRINALNAAPLRMAG
jgi:DNA repair and recombination protein RAD52